MFINSLVGLERCPDMEMGWARNGMPEIPGYLVECTDGHTYLMFAPDMSSLKNIHAYWRVLSMVKQRMSDHEYDPMRDCISPALTSEIDTDGSHKPLRAPASEMGKVYLVE